MLSQPSSPAASESHWTPQILIGGLAFLSVLGVLCFMGVTATDAAERGQIIIALTGIGSSGATFFLGNLQRPRQPSSTTTTVPTDATPVVVETEAH